MQQLKSQTEGQSADNLYKELDSRLTSVENILYQGKEVLTLEEAAQFLGVTKSSLYKMTHFQTIPYYKPSGKLVYFEKSELLSWLRKNKVLSKDEIDEEARIHMQTLSKKH